MKRRALVCGSVAMLAQSLVSDALAAGQRKRIGLLNTAKPGRPEAAFREGLQALGYVEGEHLVIDSRGANGHSERLPTLARELLGARPDVIVTFGALAAQAAKDATTTTPIVMAFAGDPIGMRLIESLAKPGGNVTGMSLATPELAGKRLELLKEILPKLTHLTVLGDISRQLEIQETQEAARALGLTVALVEFTRAEALDRALTELSNTRPEALLVLSSAVTITHQARIATFALKNRMPLVSSTSEWAAAGALLIYAPSLSDSSRRAAPTWTRSSKASSLGSFRWNSRPSSNWLSTSRPRRPSASRFPSRSCSGRTR